MRISKKMLLLLLTGSISLFTISKVEDIKAIDVVEEFDENNLDKQSKEDKIIEENLDLEELKEEIIKLNEENKLLEKNFIKLDHSIVSLTRVIDDTDIKQVPSEDSQTIGTIERNKNIETIRKIDDWYEISYDKDGYENGFINADLVEEYEQFGISNKIKKIGYFYEDSKYYLEPDQYSTLIEVPQYEEAIIYDSNNQFYLAEIDGNIGYVKKEDVKIIDNTAVIVDISKQELKLYKDKKLILVSPVITGKPSTPTYIGIYDIYNITTRRKLIPWNSYVDVMMKFNEQIGLHDAEYHTCIDRNGNKIGHGWKNASTFGGQTYLTNGSHGCVNMLNKDVKIVYDNVDVGTPVLVKK